MPGICWGELIIGVVLFAGVAIAWLKAGKDSDVPFNRKDGE